MFRKYFLEILDISIDFLFYYGCAVYGCAVYGYAVTSILLKTMEKLKSAPLKLM